MSIAYPTLITPERLLPYYQSVFKDVRRHGSPDAIDTQEEWEQQIDTLIDKCVASDIRDKYAYQSRISKLLIKTNTPTPYKFVTLAYSPELKPLEFLERVRSFQQTRWKWGNNRIQRFEFYSKEGYNPHLHMFIWTTKKKSQIIKELAKKTKLAPNFIDVRDGRYSVHFSYVNGEKQSSKEEYMKKDDEVRSELDLPEVENFRETYDD